ncbi:MAG: EamA family transporter [Deltaproteobacteria bacterium]|nr:EamA family transporter [Deltaproteobacteria bacterium]
MSFLKNYCKVAGALLLWSTWGVLVKRLQLAPHHIVFLTTLFSLPTILVLAGRNPRTLRDNLSGARRNYPYLVLLALSLLINNYFYFAAFNQTSIAIAVFSHYTAPLFVALMAPFLIAERFEKRLLLPLFMALSGLALILAQDWLTNFSAADLKGSFYGVASGLAYAFTLIFAKRLTAYLTPLSLAFWQGFFIVVLLFPFYILSPPLFLPQSAWFLLAGIGVTHCALAPMLYLSGLKHIKAQHVAVIGYIEPLSAVLLGLLLMHEAPVWSTWLGGSAILFSGFIITSQKKTI